MTLVPQPLTSAAFAPFGDVVETPGLGRVYFDQTLTNRRVSAKPSVSIARMAPSPVPFSLLRMERHEFSTQTFAPMEVGRWLVVAAPHAPGGGPDMSKARAFLPQPGQAITYAVDVWHAPMSVFDCEGLFAIFMWNDGTATDTEFFELPAPISVAL